jgi:hypothetical protein
VELERLRERLRQARAIRAAQLGIGAGGPVCAEGRMGCPFTAGARVFDRVTGEEGEVIAGTRENVIVSAPRRANG